MSGDDRVIGDAKFNQAGYYQIRIHELFQRVDRLSINPLRYDPVFDAYGYDIIFRDLNSIFLTISSKLNTNEFQKVISIKNDINKFFKENKLYETKLISDLYNQKRVSVLNNSKWEELSQLLFDYRLIIEKMIDVHGLGNPSKSSPTKAATH